MNDPVLLLYLSHARRGWSVYVRYAGDDVYVLHGESERRSANLRFLSRAATAEYLAALFPAKGLELALMTVSSAGLDRETFGAYQRAENAPTSTELLGDDDASCSYDDLMSYLMILRDARCLA